MVARYDWVGRQKTEEETELAERIKNLGLQLDQAIKVAKERPIPPRSQFNH